MPKTKIEKRNQAEERRKKYSKLSKKERIAKLDEKFGPGLGAKKERAKLAEGS